MLLRTVVTSIAVLLYLAAPAFAQRGGTRPRAYIGASFITQPSTETLTAVTTSPLNRETATVSSTFDVRSGNGFNASVLVRAWRMLAVGAGFTSVTRSTSGTLHGSYPHPFFFNMARKVDAAFDADNRTEHAVHLNLGVVVPSRRDVSILVFGGASFFSVTQPFATALTFTDAYPYDTISAARPTAASQSASFVGFNAGADVAWYFMKNVGVGGGVRVVNGSSDTEDPFAIKTSAVNVGAGVRFRF